MMTGRIKSRWTSASGIGGFELERSPTVALSASRPVEPPRFRPGMVHAVSELVRDDGRGVWLQHLDFTSEETWRLLQWCREHGADEFAVSLYHLTSDPLAPSFRARARREGVSGGSEQWYDTDLYRLDSESMEKLRTLFPSGLFHLPAWDSDTGWAENPTFYRDGEMMLNVVSHEGYGELRILESERESLARIGLRGELVWEEDRCAELAMRRVTLAILGYEFPCLSGGPEDEWLRVHFIIESIPRIYGTYRSLNITVGTLAAWQARMAELVSGRVASAALRSSREGFSLSLSRSDSDGRMTVFVDARRMEEGLWGHFWEFDVEAAEVASLCDQCAAVVRRPTMKDMRPTAALQSDPERLVKAGRRFPLVVEANH